MNRTFAQCTMLWLAVTFAGGCHTCAVTGNSLPPQHVAEGARFPLRFDAFYVAKVRYPGFAHDHIHWMRFWPNGRVLRGNWPGTYRGLPTAADDDVKGAEGRYVVAGDRIVTEFCTVDPPRDRNVLRTSVAALDDAGGFTFIEYTDDLGRGKSKPQPVEPPAPHYSLHVVGEMRRQPDW